MFIKLEVELLGRLIDAEDNGKPLTYGQLGVWTEGSTWEDLWGDGYITAQGQGFVATVAPDTPIVATDLGKARYISAEKH